MASPETILKNARISKGISQTSLAERVGVTLRMIQRYESGDFPKYKSQNIESIDKILGTELYELLYNKNGVATAKVDAGKQISENIEDIIGLKAGFNVLKSIVAAFASEKKDAQNGSIIEPFYELYRVLVG